MRRKKPAVTPISVPSSTAMAIAVMPTAIDTRPPAITLLGSNPLTLTLGASYEDPGASAFDAFQGNLSNAIVIGGDTVNPAVAGNYTVTYDVTDSSGNAALQRTRTVSVVDTGAPAIVLNGANPYLQEAGIPYLDPGATATDSKDGDLTAAIVVGGDVVSSQQLGDFTVTYDVMDSEGNAAPQRSRLVQVRDTTPPVITMLGTATMILEYGSSYIDPGAEALDSYEQDLTSAIQVGGDRVDSTKLGTYLIRYEVADSSGNWTSGISRTVIVTDTTSPLITLIGANKVEVELDGKYAELGANAVDIVDGDLTSAVQIGGDAVDTSRPGDYVVTYNVQDLSGNRADEVRRLVYVRDPDDAGYRVHLPIIR